MKTELIDLIDCSNLQSSINNLNLLPPLPHMNLSHSRLYGLGTELLNCEFTDLDSNKLMSAMYGWKIKAGVVYEIGNGEGGAGDSAGLGNGVGRDDFTGTAQLKDAASTSYSSSTKLKDSTQSITAHSPASTNLNLTTAPLSPSLPTKIDCRAVQTPATTTSFPLPNPESATSTQNTNLASPTILNLVSNLKDDGVHEPVRDFSKLNRSNITELLHHQNLLTPYQTKLLQSAQTKHQLYPLRYSANYLPHSSLLLLTNGWSSGLRYSLCSVRNRVNKSGVCRLHKYCPFCSFLEQQKAMAKYVPAYLSGIWFSLTGSFQSSLTMTTPADYDDLVKYWDAYKLSLRSLVKEGLIRGAFWTEELAVLGMRPVRVNPHIHSLIEADEFTSEMLTKLKERVSLNLKQLLGPDCLTPDIMVKKLNSDRKLLSQVRYQLKPINLTKAYGSAWDDVCVKDREGAVQLNSQLTDLVLGYSNATKLRAKINTAGNLSPKSKFYLGTKKRDMKKAERYVRGLMREKVPYIEGEDESKTAFLTDKSSNN